MDAMRMIEETKKIAGIGSDRELCKHLGVSHGTVHHWKIGKSLPDATQAAKIAVLQGREPIAGIAAIEMERHRENAAAVKFWKSQLKKVREFIVGLMKTNQTENC